MMRTRAACGSLVLRTLCDEGDRECNVAYVEACGASFSAARVDSKGVRFPNLELDVKLAAGAPWHAACSPGCPHPSMLVRRFSAAVEYYGRGARIRTHA